MQAPCFHVCQTYNTSSHQHLPYLGFYHTLSSSTTGNFITSLSLTSNFSRQSPNKIFAAQNRNSNHRRKSATYRGKVTLKGKKENVWSIDNERAEKEKGTGKQRSRRGRRVARGRKAKTRRVLVSGAMLMEVETVLQTQETVIKPVWNTFASSVSGIWKGVGAVFSPLTAEMEPIEIGNKNENLYDCYILSHIEALPSDSGGQSSQIHRKINWVTLNPHGEITQHIESSSTGSKEELEVGNSSLAPRKMIDGSVPDQILPKFESFNFERSDVMEEDVMDNEPGLVFFEDGSYSRGPMNIPIEEGDETNYYLTPTFKFEQCLVKGCHKRLRIVHTIEFNNGGSEIQIMRVAVYEEQWTSPANVHDKSDIEFALKPFSQRERMQISELTGSWKVFEVSATPIYGEEVIDGEHNGTPCVYLCKETLKKRRLPDSSVSLGEEEIVDTQGATILWLPGNVTTYIDVDKEGILLIGVGWYSDEGINLVMERDYGVDGMLGEVRWNSEVKRRWSDPLPV